MKRAAGSDFDDEGTKWFQSPHYKEVKTENASDASGNSKDFAKRITVDSEQEMRLKKERFYDLYARISREGKFKLDLEELNKTLNIRFEDMPDESKICEIFEDVNSKSNVIARGKKNWTDHETFLCIWVVMTFCHLNDADYHDLSDKEWDAIARIIPGKNAEQCKTRWQGLLRSNLTKAPWTAEEDKILMMLVQEKGPKKWKEIAADLNKKMEIHKIFRQGKQCRERWINHLDPTINRGAWTDEEDVKLLETHLRVGKKWAEIAKTLKNRTENSVKNRWNSLMKKYKTDFDSNMDTLSTSSAYSNMSMEDLEKKIAEMIIGNKRGKGRSLNSPGSLHSRILEVPEEESPSHYSDFSVETPYIKTEDSTKSSAKKEDDTDRSESKFNSKKGGQGKKKPATTVNHAKTYLREMVTVEMQNQNPAFPPKSANLESMNDKIAQAQRMMMFDEQNGTNGNPFQLASDSRLANNQEHIISSQATYNAGPMPLFNQINQMAEPRNNLFNMPNDMNIWRNNLNGMNVNMFPQNTQAGPLPPNFFGFYSPGSFLQQPGFNITSATLPQQDGQFDQMKFAQNFTNQQQQQQPPKENKLLKLSDAKFEEKSYTLKEKPVDQLNVSDPGQQTLFYAVVDLSGGQMFILDQVSKDNYPPTFMQNKQKSNVQTNASLGNLDMIGNSPALNHTSWTSPPIGTGALLNYPLFNNAFASLAFKNQFSPNLNLFQESPQLDKNLFGSTSKLEGMSTEWTPETMNRPIFSGLSMKQCTGMSNSRGDTPPQTTIGTNGGAFLRRVNDKPKGMPGTSQEGLKYSSPSSFLQTSQSNHMNRNMINAGYEKM